MSDEMKNTSSASMAVENAENVIKAEFNNLKRKLEETEAELETEKKKSKQKLDETEAELAKYKALVAGGVKLRPRRAKISLTLTDCAKLFAKKWFSIFSEPVDVADFQWKLNVQEKSDGFLGYFLYPYPPAHFKGPFEFDVNMSFRLFNVFPEKDIQKHCTKKFKRDDPPYGWGFTGVIEIKELLDPANGFVQADGSIQLEVHFTVVQIAAPDHLQPAEEKENGNKTGAN